MEEYDIDTGKRITGSYPMRLIISAKEVNGKIIIKSSTVYKDGDTFYYFQNNNKIYLK